MPVLLIPYFLLRCAESIQGVPTKRITSRRKLSKLNNGQFMELARDVYDEMVRRHEMKGKVLLVELRSHRKLTLSS